VPPEIYLYLYDNFLGVGLVWSFEKIYCPLLLDTHKYLVSTDLVS